MSTRVMRNTFHHCSAPRRISILFCYLTRYLCTICQQWCYKSSYCKGECSENHECYNCPVVLIEECLYHRISSLLFKRSFKGAEESVNGESFKRILCSASPQIEVLCPFFFRYSAHASVVSLSRTYRQVVREYGVITRYP